LAVSCAICWADPVNPKNIAKARRRSVRFIGERVLNYPAKIRFYFDPGTDYPRCTAAFAGIYKKAGKTFISPASDLFGSVYGFNFFSKFLTALAMMKYATTIITGHARYQRIELQYIAVFYVEG
jgi:hypothetical protein